MKLALFEAHGFQKNGSSGDNAYGDCPFCGRKNKFYVSSKTLLWDCKVCQREGNWNTFLGEIASRNFRAAQGHYKELADDRGIPSSAFEEWAVGLWGRTWTIPVFNAEGAAVNLMTYKTGSKKMMSTPKPASRGLLGHQRLKDQNRLDEPVLLCEGEWDAIAARWLLSAIDEPGIVCAVPGASIFKQDWVPCFEDREVWTFYDHDEAGEAGERKCREMLGSTARDMFHAHWPEELPRGYDLRDFIKQIALGERKKKKCFKGMRAMLRNNLRSSLVQEEESSSKTTKKGPRKKRPKRSLKDVHNVYQKWLHLPNTDVLDTVLATFLANRMESENPVWLFVVGPPGAGKTAGIKGLRGCREAVFRSSVSPQALISGFGLSSKGSTFDPSLIPKLNGKVFIVKDFTAVLSLNDKDKEKIFGILRDAYDGECSWAFGNGTRSYKSSFGMIAATTPVIYEGGKKQAAVGERFLKICTGHNLLHQEERQLIRAAIGNINRTTSMNNEMQDVVAGFIENFEPDNTSISQEMEDKIISLVQFGSRLRGTVGRSQYRWDEVTTKPSAEIGTRIGVQISKLGYCIPAIRSKKKLITPEYRLLRKIVLDTVPQRREDLVRCMVVNCETENDRLSTSELSAKTRYPKATVRRMLEDMEGLEIVNRTGSAMNKHKWTLTRYVRDSIIQSGLYETEEERNRVTLMRKVLRIKKKRRQTK